MSHTPQFNGRCAACTHDDRSVVILCPYHAAAPELVAACQDAIEVYEHMTPTCCQEFTDAVYERLRAALARVKGE